MFEGNYDTEPEVGYVALLQILPVLFRHHRAPEIRSQLYGCFGENLDK